MSDEDYARQERQWLEEAEREIVRCLDQKTGPGFGKLSETTSHVYITNLDTSLNIDILKENGIRAVLYLDNQNKSKEALKAYRDRKIDHMFVPMADDIEANIMGKFEPCYQYIHQWVEKEKKVLVHCAAGMSRSAAVVMYYFLKRYYVVNAGIEVKVTRDLMDIRNYHIVRVVSMVKDCRPCVRPNPGFVRQLLLAERQLKHAVAQHYGRDLKKIADEEIEGDDSSDEDDIERSGKKGKKGAGKENVKGSGKKGSGEKSGARSGEKSGKRSGEKSGKRSGEKGKESGTKGTKKKGKRNKAIGNDAERYDELADLHDLAKELKNEE